MKIKKYIGKQSISGIEVRRKIKDKKKEDAEVDAAPATALVDVPVTSGVRRKRSGRGDKEWEKECKRLD